MALIFHGKPMHLKYYLPLNQSENSIHPAGMLVKIINGMRRHFHPIEDQLNTKIRVEYDPILIDRFAAHRTNLVIEMTLPGV